MSDTFTWSSSHIICPYCGYKHEDNYDDLDIFYSEGEHDYKCYDCEKKFIVNTQISYHYSSEELD